MNKEQKANVKAAVITVSTKGIRGEREDKSGPAACRKLEAAGIDIVRTDMVGDDQEAIASLLRKIADAGEADLIFTSGGTGFAKDDCTPEATLEVVERQTPGIAEAMRAYSMQFTKRAMLSRAAAGIRKETLIVNLPGSPKAVEECLDGVLQELIHGILILKGETGECARK